MSVKNVFSLLKIDTEEFVGIHDSQFLGLVTDVCRRILLSVTKKV